VESLGVVEADKVAVPLLTLQLTACPDEPAPRASSTRTTSGAGSATFTGPLCASPEIRCNVAAGGTR